MLERVDLAALPAIMNSRRLHEEGGAMRKKTRRPGLARRKANEGTMLGLTSPGAAEFLASIAPKRGRADERLRWTLMGLIAYRGAGFLASVGPKQVARLLGVSMAELARLSAPLIMGKLVWNGSTTAARRRLRALLGRRPSVEQLMA